MKSEIWLNRDELKKIQDVLDKFDTVEAFQVFYESFGIGKVVEIGFNHKTNGVTGYLKIPITDENDW